MRRIAIFLISSYQIITKYLLLSRCRFYPPCSEYGRSAICQYGILKGLYLTLRRIIRCHPLNKGGFDPLPLKEKLSKQIKNRQV